MIVLAQDILHGTGVCYMDETLHQAVWATGVESGRLHLAGYWSFVVAPHYIEEAYRIQEQSRTLPVDVCGFREGLETTGYHQKPLVKSIMSP